MIVLVPMGGKSTRFIKEGYINKTFLEVTSRHDGKKYPMALSALLDIPWIKQKQNTVVCVNSPEHSDNGLEKEILKYLPKSIFIPDYVQLDQAFGCLLARSLIDRNEDLFIGACDNGFDIDLRAFNELKRTSDMIVFTHTDDLNIRNDPFAHSWLSLKRNSSSIKKLSFKQTISEIPFKDHATTGMFWFKNSKIFLGFLEKMILSNDSHGGKFYIDKLVNYYVDSGYQASILDVKYYCWGTPNDYEVYEKSIQYWLDFKPNLG